MRLTIRANVRTRDFQSILIKFDEIIRSDLHSSSNGRWSLWKIAQISMETLWVVNDVLSDFPIKRNMLKLCV